MPVFVLVLTNAQDLDFPFRATLLWLTMCQFHNYLEIEVCNIILVYDIQTQYQWIFPILILFGEYQKVFNVSISFLFPLQILPPYKPDTEVIN